MKKGRIALDAIMSVLLVLQMLYLLVGEAWHEIAGCVLFILFALHHVLNRRWYRALGKGRYNRLRIAFPVIDALCLISIAALAISGVMMSRHVFAFLNISVGMDAARIMHMLASYWGFFLISMHAGMHMASLLKRRSAVIAAAVISIYGSVSFIREGIPSYMFLRSMFVFFDFDSPLLLVALRYSSMMILFMTLGALLSLGLRKR